MKAYQIRDEWSLENLQLVDLPEPVPGPGEVLVEIKAASLNYRDPVSYTHLTLPTNSRV